jgi:hypothetical protein
MPSTSARRAGRLPGEVRAGRRSPARVPSSSGRGHQRTRVGGRAARTGPPPRTSGWGRRGPYWHRQVPRTPGARFREASPAAVPWAASHGRRLGSLGAAPGLGAEARPLHRVRAGRRGERARPPPGGLAPAVPGHLRDRPAQPGPADPLRDPQRARRRLGGAVLRPVDRPRGRDAPGADPAVLRRQPPLRRRVRPHGVQPLGGARLHERPQLHRPGRRAGPQRRAHRGAPARRRRRPLHLQPRAHRRLRRPRGPGRRRGGGQRDHRGGRRLEGLRQAGRQPGRRSCGTSPASPGSTSRRCTSPATSTTAASPPPSPSTRPRRPWSRSAPSPTWPSGRTRSASWSRSPRWCTTASTSRSSGAAPGAAGSARPG